ncbi:MarR family winged helix-turn-helix transcriptional regulator [Rhodococcus sp. NPDC058521]|uniref:MarR family winged helix-turn-helix transcriptional regulator n=1 Tax=Rhodococcus sp. NPDC058521 TaxID=3346536 RepID=UPI00364DDA27
MPTAEPHLRNLLIELVSSSHRFNRLVASFGTDAHPRSWLRALSLLSEHEELRISDFARIDRCSQPTATALLGKLTEADLVTRSSDPEDARAVRVALTDAGRRYLDSGRSEIADRLTPHFAHLDEAQIGRLTEGLDELRTILQAQGTPNS